MHGFWNDPEGISITDFLALSFSGVYMVLNRGGTCAQAARAWEAPSARTPP